MNELVKMARAVAITAHLGQVDKVGDPYIGHVERVARRVVVYRDPIRHAVAYLHDVVEDTPLTVGRLTVMGFPVEVLEAVDALTHPPGETNAEYWARVKQNPVARDVKLADIDDNADPYRLALINDPATRERLAVKYARAREALGA